MGKSTGVKKKLRLAQVSSAYVGKPFEEGGWGNSYDCSSFLISIADKLGLHKSAEGSLFSKEGHGKLVDLWNTDREEAMRMAMDYLNANGEQVAPMRMRPGDVVIFSFKQGGETTFGLCGGNGHVLGSFINKGVTLVKTDILDIEKVFRLKKEREV